MTRRRTIYRPANAQGVSERYPEEEVRLALTKAGDYGRPDVVMLSEVSWLEVPRLAERLDLFGVQFGERGSPEAGVALVSRRPIFDAQLRPGSDAVPGEVRARGILTARTFARTVAAIHAPPGRTAGALRDYMHSLRRLADNLDVIGGDWNLDRVTIRRAFPDRHYTGRGVMGVSLDRDSFDGLGATTHVRIRSDHDAVDVPTYRKARR